MVRLSWEERVRERERGSEEEGWRRWCMDSQSANNEDILKEKRSCWPLVLIDKEKREGALKCAEGDGIWCSETSFFHVQPLSGGVHSWLSALSQARTTNAVWPVSQCRTQTHTYTNTHAGFSSPRPHRAHVCHYKRTFTVPQPVCERKNVKLVEIPHFEHSRKLNTAIVWILLDGVNKTRVETVNYTPCRGLTDHRSVSQDYVSVEESVPLKWYYKQLHFLSSE